MNVYIPLNKDALSGTALALFVFIAMGPFFTWAAPQLYMLVFGAAVVCALFISFSRHVTRKSMLICIAYLCILLVTYFPFRPHDELRLGLLTLFVPVAYFFYLDRVSLYSRKMITSLFYCIALLSIVSWVLYLLGVPFPNVSIKQTNAVDSNYYDLYFGVPILNSQYIDIPGGLKVFRNNGWFAEPSHYGIYAALVIAAQNRPFHGALNKLLLVSILLTFSLAAYLCVIVVYLVRTESWKKYILYSALALVVVGLFITSSFGEAILDRYLLAKISDEEALAARVRFGGPPITDLGFYRFLLGFGFDYIGANGWMLSDYRAHIYKFGALSLFLVTCFWVVCAVSDIRRRSAVLTISLITLLVLSHRSWMLVGPVFMFFLWVAMVERKRIKS